MMINLLEKFFDDPNTITEDEMHEAIRKATIDIIYHSYDVWVIF